MINLYDLGQVYIFCGRTDMRRGIDGLVAIVKDKFDLNIFVGRSLSSAVAVAIVSRLCIGTVRDIGYYIKGLKMTDTGKICT